MRIGVDTGGTFTDAVWQAADGRWQLTKLPTSPECPATAVLKAVDTLARGESSVKKMEGVDLVHGTTHATNALLTGRLGKVVLVTTAGFRDLLAIGRQDRDQVYALEPRVSRPQQPRRLVVEVVERVGADGTVVKSLARAEITRVVAAVKKLKPEAIAVALLHSYKSPEHEQKLAQALRKLGVPVMVSHAVAPEIREYERATTTWADASLAPVVGGALLQLDHDLRRFGSASRLRVMRSDGGTAAVASAVEHPVNLALSGPAGGLSAAISLARCRGDRQLMTLDMGGTSTDVAWLDSAMPEQRPVSVGGLPLLVRGLPIHSVGTGGGSLAQVDAGGQIQVGPSSSGAVPGPVCYGRGGTRATLSDAHLLCGRLLPHAFLGGTFALHLRPAQQAFAVLGKSVGLSAFAAACQVLQVASADMERALRRVSLAEGRDPRDAVLYSFGGAGGLHAAWLSERLHMKGVVVPPLAGAFSALGLLGAPPRRRITRSVLAPLPNLAIRRSYFAPLVRRLKQELLQEGCAAGSLRVERLLELRGQGQAGILLLAEGPRVKERFHAMHQQRFGFTRTDCAVELSAISVQVDGASENPWKRRRKRLHRAQACGTERVWFGHVNSRMSADCYEREALSPGAWLDGPAIITEYSATTLIPPRWRASIDAWNCLFLERLA